jgi:glycosyltransferase involved in cell wall biosynthesis
MLSSSSEKFSQPKVEPLISIVTGIYNSSRFLKSYFQMLDLQTFRNWEALLVDDGSNDDSCSLIEEKCKADPRYRLIRKKAEGFPSRSRAVGLAQARGLYVAFCDHDDFWAPQKLEFQLAVLQRFKDASIVHTDRFVWSGENHPSEYFRFDGGIEKVPVRQQQPEEVIYRGLRIIFSSFIGHTELVRKVGFHPDMKGVDDFYLFVRLAQMGSIYHVELPLTYYSAHLGNLSFEKNIFVEGFYKVSEVLNIDDVPQIAKDSIRSQALRTEAVSLFSSDRRRALQLLWMSLRLYFIPSTLTRLMVLLVTFPIPLLLQKHVMKWIKFVKFKIPTFRDLWLLFSKSGSKRD